MHLHIVENLEHRAGKDAEGKTGDGVGILLQISHKFFSAEWQTAGGFDMAKKEITVSRMLLLPPG